MGEIAEGLINGDFDFFTGEYLGRGYGFPRGRGLWHKIKNSPNYKKNPRRGVIKYLQNLYAGRKRTAASIKIARHFFHEMGGEFISEEKMFESISANFKLFVEWMKENKEKMYQTY